MDLAFTRVGIGSLATTSAFQTFKGLEKTKEKRVFRLYNN